MKSPGRRRRRGSGPSGSRTPTACRLTRPSGSWTTLRNIDGTFRIRLGAAPEPGNWIWLDSPGDVGFVLTLIDTPTAASVSMVELDMPKIALIGCADA